MSFLTMPEAFNRRRLPHLQCDDKPHFVTFCTYQRRILPERVRFLALDSCLHDNGSKFDLRVAVVMPDHVHMIFTPLVNTRAREIYSLAEIMDAVKGASAHRINKILGRKGRVWQSESFDHVLRSSESLDAKVQYLLENPVRRGLVSDWADYPWLWKKTYMNPFAWFLASDYFQSSGASLRGQPGGLSLHNRPSFPANSANLNRTHAGGSHSRVGMFC